MKRNYSETEARRDAERQRLLEAVYRGRFDAPPREIWAELDARRLRTAAVRRA